MTEVERLRELCRRAAERIDDIPVSAYEYEASTLWDGDQALVAELRTASLGEIHD